MSPATPKNQTYWMLRKQGLPAIECWKRQKMLCGFCDLAGERCVCPPDADKWSIFDYWPGGVPGIHF